MVIILDNVINNIDSVKVEIQDILKDENINEEWCTFEKNHKFHASMGLTVLDTDTQRRVPQESRRMSSNTFGSILALSS